MNPDMNQEVGINKNIFNYINNLTTCLQSIN